VRLHRVIAPSIFQTSWRVIATEIAEVLSAISRASSRAAGSSSFGACRLRTSPAASASLAGNTRR